MPTYTNKARNTATYTNDSKSRLEDDFLLLQDGSYALLQTGDRIVLIDGIEYTGTSKTSRTYTNKAKNE